MTAHKFKTAIKRAFKAYIPAHIVEQLEFVRYEEWRDYRKITIGIASKGSISSDKSEWPINLTLLQALAKLFDTNLITIRGGVNIKGNDWSDQRPTEGITVHIHNANFEKVLRGKDKGASHPKEKTRFELIDED